MKKTLFSLLLPALPALAICCSCIGYTSFCELIKPDTRVARVRVINRYFWPTVAERKFWIDVVVVETLQGDVQEDTMTILASWGTSCDPDYAVFNIDEQFIVHINEAYQPGPTDWPSFAFENGCREEYLSLKNGQVSGFIKENYTDMPYLDFKQQLGTCVNFTRTRDREELNSIFSLLPNPAASEVYIYCKSLVKNYTLKIYNAVGQLMLSETVANGNSHHLALDCFNNGVYFIKIQVGNEFITKRLVVQR